MILSLLVVTLLEVDPSPPPVVRQASAPAYPVGDKGTATLFYNALNGSPDVAVGTLELRPGASVAEHSHDGSGEWLYVMRGEVELTTLGQTLVAKAGDVVHLPKGQKHSAKVPSTAKEPFVAVQLYSPAGPEQRFVKKPDAGTK